MTTSRLAAVVPRLPPEMLHRIIQARGLEHAAEFVALATPAQLTRVLDVDLWQARAAGADERFDADRFGAWLEVLMECGPEVAAEKLAGLDQGLVVAGLSRHAAVFDHAAVSPFTTLDGEEAGGRASGRPLTAEIGGYLVEARIASTWGTVVDLLAFLQVERAEYLHRLMRGCVRLSSGPREADGFHTLLDDSEQNMFDLASDREARRERQGYVTPAQARAFMQAARACDLDDPQSPRSPLARAYFRELEPETAPQDTGAAGASFLAPEAMADMVEVLREAGVTIDAPRALLPSAGAEPTRLALLEDYAALHPSSVEELAYLANAVLAGCSIQGRPFAPQEAADAASAICNLGLEAWPPHWHVCDLVSAFHVGLTMVHRDVAMYAARRLLAIIATIECPDRDVQMQVRRLRRDLARSIRSGEPWLAREALDVLLALDAPSWAALVGLTGECPVLHGAMRPAGARAIDPDGYEFISQRRQLTLVQEFLASLPGRLAA